MKPTIQHSYCTHTYIHTAHTHTRTRAHSHKRNKTAFYLIMDDYGESNNNDKKARKINKEKKLGQLVVFQY